MRYFSLRLQEVLVVGESSAASESGDLEQTGRINIYSFNQTGLLYLYGVNLEKKISLSFCLSLQSKNVGYDFQENGGRN